MRQTDQTSLTPHPDSLSQNIHLRARLLAFVPRREEKQIQKDGKEQKWLKGFGAFSESQS